VASIEEFSRFDFVLEVKTPGDTLESTCAAALYNRMLTTPKDLSNEVVHILVLRLESVSRCERTGSTRVRANEELGSRLSVGPAGRALVGQDVCIQTTVQAPSHDEGGIVGDHTWGGSGHLPPAGAS